MHYIIYKTTNLINGKFYIGKHQTNDLNDGYVGSGKLLKRAIKKYGMDNFKTEIVETCPTEVHMNMAERIYVVVDREVSYNICPGGKGGFGYIRDMPNYKEFQLRGAKAGGKASSRIQYARGTGLFSKETRLKVSAGMKIRHQLGIANKPPGTKGFVFSADSKNKMSTSAKGSKNSQYGTIWITNGNETFKIQSHELDRYILNGYRRGRK